jgi:molybdopterin adenylyltransferase
VSHEQHKSDSAQLVVRCAVVTVSDSRTESTDASGSFIRAELTKQGHTIADYAIIPNDPEKLDRHLAALFGRTDIDALLIHGGTGVSHRDQTIDIVTRRLELILPGFGELFRTLSYNQIGSAALLSRAIAGVARRRTDSPKLLFSIPGSTKAVKLAMTQLIMPELRHLLSELRRS